MLVNSAGLLVFRARYYGMSGAQSLQHVLDFFAIHFDVFRDHFLVELSDTKTCDLLVLLKSIGDELKLFNGQFFVTLVLKLFLRVGSVIVL